MTAPQDPNPWSYASETVSGPVVYPEPMAAPERGRRRRKLPLFIAAGTVVALVLGGVAYAGLRLWFGSGAQPEEAAPSTVVAFARLDFSPGYGHRVKINNLVRKFPRQSGKDAVDELKKEIFDELGVDKAAYGTHVEPWFADRAGLGLWFNDKEPYALVVLSSKDDAAARSGLAELQHKKGADDLGFVVRGGHALVVVGEDDAQAAAELAAKDAERESLAESATFRRGADWLPDNQTAVVWADLGRVGDTMPRLIQRALGGQLAPFVFGGSGLGRPILPAGLKGQVILGAQATDNGVEIRFRSFGAGAAAPDGTAKSTVDSLPGNSAVAGSFRVGELGKDIAGSMFAGPDLDELLKKLPKDAQDVEAFRETTRRTAAIGKAVAALAGARVTVAATAIGDDVPMLSASAELTSPDKATALTDALELFGDEVTVTASGTRVELRTKGYAPGGGKLSEQSLYREALAGADQRASDILFVDVQRLVADTDMSERERREIAPFKAIALSTGSAGGDPVGLIRLVIR